MKKSFIFISCIILLFTGCSSKELENKIVELENKVTELQTKIIEDENQKLTFADECQKLENRILNLEQKIEVQNQINKVFIDYNDIFNQEKYEIHELQYSLDFKYDGFNIRYHHKRIAFRKFKEFTRNITQRGWRILSSVGHNI